MKCTFGIELLRFYFALSGLKNIYESRSQGCALRLLIMLRWSLSIHLAFAKKTRDWIEIQKQFGSI